MFSLRGVCAESGRNPALVGMVMRGVGGLCLEESAELWSGAVAGCESSEVEVVIDDREAAESEETCRDI